MDYVPPRGTALFVLRDVLKIAELGSTARYAHVDADVIETVLDHGARFASDIIAPLNEPGDRLGARFDAGKVYTSPGFVDAYRRYVEGGWPTLSVPSALGGQDLPLALQTAFSEMVCGGCLAFGMLPVMARAGAQVLLEHASPALIETYGRRLATGEWSATICITEPQAGSDVGRITSIARPTDDGHWVLNGTKMFISYAAHDLCDQIIHLVLARTPDAEAGSGGLSLFLVPARLVGEKGELGSANGVHVARIERKMGLRASPTCEVSFTDAVAIPIGARGHGLRCMFTMINLMRLEVAIQGVAIAEAATGAAVSYATIRRQGGPPNAEPRRIAEHADVRRMLLTMRTETDGIRALVLETALQLDIARSAGDPDERAEAQSIAELLLPVCKARGADIASTVANLAVQVFGGHGYISENGVEQLVRDCRVISIYEGTNGIQALDLVVRKLSRSGSGWPIFQDRVRAEIARHPSAPVAGQLKHCLDLLETCVSALRDRSRRDNEAGAAALLELLGLVAVGWMWLRMLRAGAKGDRAAMITACTEWWRVGSEMAPALVARISAGAGSLDSAPHDVLDPLGDHSP